MPFFEGIVLKLLESLDRPFIREFFLLATQGKYIPNNVFKAKKLGSALFFMPFFEGIVLKLLESLDRPFIREFFLSLLHKVSTSQTLYLKQKH